MPKKNFRKKIFLFSWGHVQLKLAKIRVKNAFFVFCLNVALLINSVSLSMTLLVETHLFNTEKVRTMQRNLFRGGGGEYKKMLKINQNRQFY